MVAIENQRPIVRLFKLLRSTEVQLLEEEQQLTQAQAHDREARI